MTKTFVLFGGSFDPIHMGHTQIARFVLSQLNADKLFFIPARRSPFKDYQPAPNNDRIEMLRLAICNNTAFEICDCELNRPEPSYTIDTINHFLKRFGENTKLYWLLGADMVKDLHKWYKIDELLQKCKICIVNRGGFDEPDYRMIAEVISIETAEQLKQNSINAPLIDISSTDIRKMVHRSEDISSMVGAEVADYIKKNGLYCNK